MTIRHAGNQAIVLLLIVVGLAGSVELATKAGPVPGKPSNDAETLAIFASYRTWTKMNSRPMMVVANQRTVPI
jgi:hypothetical protein